MVVVSYGPIAVISSDTSRFCQRVTVVDEMDEEAPNCAQAPRKTTTARTRYDDRMGFPDIPYFTAYSVVQISAIPAGTPRLEKDPLSFP